jgi:AraC family transcriptional regulator
MDWLLRPTTGVGRSLLAVRAMFQNVMPSSCLPKLISIDEILCARPQQPIATTRGRGWKGVTVDCHRPYFNWAETDAGLDHHLIGYCPSGSARLIQTRA